MGLMQLLPSVGKGMAKEMKIKHFSPDEHCWWLIRIFVWVRATSGTSSITTMARWEYALAAYNAARTA